MDIYLKKAIMHIVDRTTGDPVYSQRELDLTTEYIREYLTKKIQKLATPQTKTGKIVDNSAVAQMLADAETNFIEVSERFVQRWYAIYSQSEDAPSGDVFVVLYELDTKLYFAFLKVNYTEGYTHFIETEDAMIQNQLILHRAILAGKTQKADEGITIEIESMNYELIEKKFTFSGEKGFYFSTKVIEAEPQLSLEENVKVIKKVAEKIGQKFETPKYDVIADIKEAVYDTIEETGQIDAKEVAAKVFKDNITAQMAFQEEVVEKGFVDNAPMLREVREISEKKFGKQKLKLSNGIELIVPLDVYRNPDLIEFVTNPDGTISVTIKNVDEVINRI